MYYPLTSWFVLFCNSITSCHLEDLNLLETLASVLMPHGSFSHPVTVIQRLCGDFIALSQSHLSIRGCGASISVGNTSCLPPSDSMQHHAKVHSVIAPFSGSTPGFFTSDQYEMYSNGDGASAVFDHLLPNTLALDLWNDPFLSGGP